MYQIGQKVCLWQEVVTPGCVTVVKEVIVTITEIKTGVLGEWSQKPVSSPSLKGLGDDGKVYEKHWEYWPESQTSDFMGQWSARDDGPGEDEYKYWIPKEAVYAHSMLQMVNKRENPKIVRIDTSGNPVVPKGDVSHCADHDQYFYTNGGDCFHCRMAMRKSAA